MVSKNLDIMVPWALGSDTGGSIREPAAFCGVVGLKPTYGLVSRYGLVAFASSLDQIGPITKDVRDSAMLLNIITGHDEKDSTSYDRPKEDYDAYYKKAQKVRTFVKKQFDENFKKYDVLLTPVAPTTAFEIGSKSNNPIEMYLVDICTVSINIASVPAISIPCGVDKNGMPVGMQLIGDRFSEAKLLNAAYTFEQKIQFKQNHKPEFKK